jgi:hypothetical protein
MKLIYKKIKILMKLHSKNFDYIYNYFSFADEQKNEFNELLEKTKMNKIPEIVKKIIFLLNNF